MSRKKKEDMEDSPENEVAEEKVVSQNKGDSNDNTSAEFADALADYRRNSKALAEESE